MPESEMRPDGRGPFDLAIAVDSFRLGGAEKQARLLARGMAGKGLRVCLISLSSSIGDPGDWDLGGIPAFSVDRPERRGNAAGRLVRTAAFLAGLCALIRRLRPRVVAAFTYHPNMYLGLAMRFFSGAAFFWNQRDVGLGLKGGFLEKAALGTARKAVCNSRHAADALRERCGLASHRVAVIPNACALPAPVADRSEWRRRLGLGPGDLAVCMPSNISANKDHPTLLEAWRRFLGEYGVGREVRLLLAGRDDWAPGRLRAALEDPALLGTVMHLGFVEDMAGLLSACDIGAYSSRSEGCANGVLECALSSLPVIGCDIPGIRMGVSPENHPYLTPAGDAASMAAALSGLARDPVARASAGRANRAFVEREFGPDRMVALFYGEFRPYLGG